MNNAGGLGSPARRGILTGSVGQALAIGVPIGLPMFCLFARWRAADSARSQISRAITRSFVLPDRTRRAGIEFHV